MPETQERRDFAAELAATTRAVSLSWHWWGTSKTLTPDQISASAAVHGAKRDTMSGSKKLISTKHPQWKALTKIKTATTAFWESLSLPFPEGGVRLMKETDVPQFTETMAVFAPRLSIAAEEFAAEFGEIVRSRQADMDQLFDPSDYPSAETIPEMFGFEYSFPNTTPPDYLFQLNPELWHRENNRVKQQFESAVILAETAFTAELSKMVDRLVDNLQGLNDGTCKKFRDVNVDGLKTFFQRFRNLSVGSNADLDRVVAELEGTLANVTPERLKDSRANRDRIGTAVEGMAAQLDLMIVDKPARRFHFGQHAAGAVATHTQKQLAAFPE